MLYLSLDDVVGEDVAIIKSIKYLCQRINYAKEKSRKQTKTG